MGSTITPSISKSSSTKPRASTREKLKYRRNQRQATAGPQGWRGVGGGGVAGISANVA
jgi:hypothetical protein